MAAQRSMQLSDAQKKDLFHTGYVILKGVVSDELVANARARIKAGARPAETANHSAGCSAPPVGSIA